MPHPLPTLTSTSSSVTRQPGCQPSQEAAHSQGHYLSAPLSPVWGRCHGHPFVGWGPRQGSVNDLVFEGDRWGCCRRCDRPAPSVSTGTPEGIRTLSPGHAKDFRLRFSGACVRNGVPELSPPEWELGQSQAGRHLHPLSPSASCPEVSRQGALRCPLNPQVSARPALPTLGSPHHWAFMPAPPSKQEALLTGGEPVPRSRHIYRLAEREGSDAQRKAEGI